MSIYREFFDPQAQQRAALEAALDARIAALTPAFWRCLTRVARAQYETLAAALAALPRSEPGDEALRLQNARAQLVTQLHGWLDAALDALAHDDGRWRTRLEPFGFDAQPATAPVADEDRAAVDNAHFVLRGVGEGLSGPYGLGPRRWAWRFGAGDAPFVFCLERLRKAALFGPDVATSVSALITSVRPTAPCLRIRPLGALDGASTAVRLGDVDWARIVEREPGANALTADPLFTKGLARVARDDAPSLDIDGGLARLSWHFDPRRDALRGALAALTAARSLAPTPLSAPR